MDDLERLLRELETLKRKQVRIGLQRGKKHKGKNQADLVDIAVYNEFGTSSIPARPFFAQTVEQQGEFLTEFSSELAGRLVDGTETAESVLKKIGTAAKGAVQYQITNGGFVPNAPATVKRKKSDQPLIDTGLMRQSIQFIICDKGEDSDV